MGGRSVRAALLFMAAFTALAVPGPAAVGESMSNPAGHIILTVSGKITNTNAENEARFDFAMLNALPEASVRTTTPWTDGKQLFSGVLMRDLMEEVGAYGSNVRAIALNNYSYVIEMSDFIQYPVVLAYAQNGNRLRIRDKGPLWIIYPRDDFDELRERSVEPRMVWQLQRLVIE